MRSLAEPHALAAAVFPHDRELDAVDVAGLQEAVVDGVAQLLHDRGVQVRPVPTVDHARDAVLQPLLDVPIGHFRLAFVVPADHRLPLRPGLDRFPAVVGAVFP